MRYDFSLRRTIKMKARTGSSFLASFVAAVLGVALGWLAFCVIVDPYRRFELVSIAGFNLNKPQVAHQVRLTKAHQVCRLQPDNVILGTSRAELGIDPDDAAFRSLGGRTYNLAMAGTGVWEMARTLKHAHFARRLKVAVIGLDFHVFNAYLERTIFQTTVFNFDEGRLLASPQDSCRRTFFHDISWFLGPAAAKAAWRTVRDQNSSTPLAREYYLPNGRRDVVNNIAAMTARRLGHRGVFISSERSYMARIWRNGAEKRYCLDDPETGRSTLEGLRDIVTFAYRNDIELRLYISPEHTRLLFALMQIGLWPQYEDWKRGLVETIERAAREHGKPVVRLIDFSGFNSITTEPVPTAGDLRPMRFYFEGSHYTPQVGGMILARLFDRAPGADPRPDFGQPLNAASIDANIATIRTRLRQYEHDFADAAAEIRRAADEVMEGEDGANCGLHLRELRAASAAMERGQRDEAERAIARAYAIYQADRRRYAEIGVPFRETPLDRSAAQVRAGRLLWPPLARWQDYQERGRKRAEAGDLEGAIEDYTRAMRRGPANAALYYLRGVAYLELGNKSAAAADFEAGLKIAPGNIGLTRLMRRAKAM
jgi:hypothetical protein